MELDFDMILALLCDSNGNEFERIQNSKDDGEGIKILVECLNDIKIKPSTINSVVEHLRKC